MASAVPDYALISMPALASRDPSPSWGLALTLLGSLLSLVVFHPLQALLMGALALPLGLRWPRVIWLGVGLVAGGGQGLVYLAGQVRPDCQRQVVPVVARVVDFVDRGSLGDGTKWQRAELALAPAPEAACRGPGRVQLRFYAATPVLALGDTVTGLARLRAPPSQWNPGSLPQQAGNAARGIDAVGTLMRIDEHRVGTHPIAALRQRLATGIDALALSAATRGLLRALLLADASGVGVELWQAFRQLGIAHVLVVSGLHIGTIAGSVWLLVGGLRRLARFPGDSGSGRLAGAAVLAVAAGYACLAGLSLPTVRALVMLAAGLGTRFAGWAVSPLRGLLLAAVGLLLADPLAALGAGFWLSCLGTLVLLTAIGNRGSRGGLGVALAVQGWLVLLMLPATLFWFGQSSLAAIPANLLIVPVFALWVLPLGLAGLVLSLAQPAAGQALLWLAGQPLEVLLPVLLALVEVGDERLLLTRQLPVLGVLALAAGVLALRVLPGHGRLAGAALVLLALAAPNLHRATELAVLDVGQGLAIVFRHAGKTLVYDTGGGDPNTVTQAERVLVPFLRSVGVDTIDTLVVSHGDLDHAAGIGVLKARFAIGEHLGSGGTPCATGRRWRWAPDVTLTLLGGSGQDAAARNNDSCVVMLEVGPRRFLLAGDIGTARERELVRYWRERLQADVLVVAHHGSATSTSPTFLKWVDPGRAVLSYGRGNPFGHPAAAVVERLRHRGVVIDATAVHGAIRYRVDDTGALRVIPMRGGWLPYWLQIPRA